MILFLVAMHQNLSSQFAEDSHSFLAPTIQFAQSPSLLLSPWLVLKRPICRGPTILKMVFTTLFFQEDSSLGLPHYHTLPILRNPTFITFEKTSNWFPFRQSHAATLGLAAHDDAAGIADTMDLAASCIARVDLEL